METDNHKKMILITIGVIALLAFAAPTLGCVIMGSAILYHLMNKRPKDDNTNK